MQCHKCNSNIPDNSLVCIVCGADQSVRARSGFAPFGTQGSIALPMNWYRFVVNIMLILDIVSSCMNAFSYTMCLIGAVPAELGEAVLFSAVSPGLIYLDIALVAIYLAMAVFAFFTRARLRDFKRNAPTLFVIYTIASILTGLINLVGSFMIVSVPLNKYAMFIPAALLYGWYVWANIKYFGKRKKLFKF